MNYTIYALLLSYYSLDHGIATLDREVKTNMAAPKRVNWVLAFKDYVSDTRETYKTIAEKYGVAVRTVESRASKEDWVGYRRSIGEKSIIKVETELIDRNSAINERHATIFKNLQQLAGTKLTIAYRQVERLVQEHGIDNLSIYDHRMISQRDLKDLVEAYTGAINGERVTAGLPTSVERKQVSSLDRKDLFIDDNYKEYIGLLAESLTALEEK